MVRADPTLQRRRTTCSYRAKSGFFRSPELKTRPLKLDFQLPTSPAACMHTPESLPRSFNVDAPVKALLSKYPFSMRSANGWVTRCITPWEDRRRRGPAQATRPSHPMGHTKPKMKASYLVFTIFANGLPFVRSF